MHPSPKTIELRARKNEWNKKFRRASSEQSKTTTLHVYYSFWFISLPLFHASNVKFAYATSYGGCKQMTNLSFTFFTCVRWSRIELRESSHIFHILSDLLYWRNANSFLWWRFAIDSKRVLASTMATAAKNVTFKVNFPFFLNICRVYSNSLKMSNVGEFPWSWFLRERIQV